MSEESSMMTRATRREMAYWLRDNQRKFTPPRLEQQIDIRGVPEENRDAEFEKELMQFRMLLYRDSTSLRWLFNLALHEGGHLWLTRKNGQECRLRGPHMVYRDGNIKCIKGAISSRQPVEYTYEFIMDTLKEWLAGPLAVSVLTGEPSDPEPDILDACAYLKMTREKVEGFVWVAENELQEEMRTPEVVQEILGAAREYAQTIFRNDFSIDWGIRRYGLPPSSSQSDQKIYSPSSSGFQASGGNPSPEL